MQALNPTLDQFQGCLLGLALGDAMGAPHEGGPLERLLWKLIGRDAKGKMRWTDDTQMSLDVAESLLACNGIDADDMARRFARSYHWSRGYGPGTARLLKRVAGGADWQGASRSVYPDGSFGNGGAMRSPVVALFFCRTPGAIADAAARVAHITHAHALGMDGAVLVACATALALQRAPAIPILDACAEATTQSPFAQRTELARQWIRETRTPDAREVARQLGNGVAAVDSCVTAIYMAARFLGAPFGDMLAFIARGGGDVDTIAAMAGAIWGAAQGSSALPAAALGRLEQRERLGELATVLYTKALAR